ncbi:dihydropyrimidinase [Desulfovibrio cuneatus]|uniref:dihydropyrimidinase n=1 Tax=Desulfovibrio cuneatus TaxID=159728 RepID=UPI000402ECA7|nr:dihydropyrimidinase [Desulfovibrio cuneatus]
MKTLITNAQIATSTQMVQGDVLIEHGKISRVAPGIAAGGARVIDAAGKFLLPGGVDAHTHLDLDTGAARAADDFLSGSIAAACGGTTTIIDHMGFGPKGCGLEHQVDVYHELARQCVVDYGFHGVIQHVDATVLEDMQRLIARGITSYKLYLTYGYKLADADVLAVMQKAQELGLMVCVHCENDASIAFLTKKLLAAGKSAPRYHAQSRPVQCEAEAVFRMLMLAKMAGEAPLYVVHLSSGLGLQAIELARHNGQQHVFAETCPQYLLLNESSYEDKREGLKFIMSPPLRTAVDNAALWQGLASGQVETVGTDHCPFQFATQKMQGLGNFTKCPNGAPGVETRMQLMFSEGFMKGRLTLPQVVQACCTRPAKLFGIAPQKGDIAPGADADLVLIDPTVRSSITKAHLHERVDYTPYEGWEVQGAPVLTMARGEVIAENGTFVGKAGRGVYLERGLPKLG